MIEQFSFITYPTSHIKRSNSNTTFHTQKYMNSSNMLQCTELSPTSNFWYSLIYRVLVFTFFTTLAVIFILGNQKFRWITKDDKKDGKNPTMIVYFCIVLINWLYSLFSLITISTQRFSLRGIRNMPPKL